MFDLIVATNTLPTAKELTASSWGAPSLLKVSHRDYLDSIEFLWLGVQFFHKHNISLLTDSSYVSLHVTWLAALVTHCIPG